MGIYQNCTYYKDYSIKTYIEKLDGEETVFKRFDKHGRLLYVRYKAIGVWERWKYNKDGYKLEHRHSNGDFTIRRLDSSNRLIYEETEKGVQYDITKKKPK